MKYLFAFLSFLALVALLFTLPLFFSSPDVETSSAENLPWDIAIDPPGESVVFGLTPGKSTLAEAEARFGEMELGVIIAKDVPADREAKDAALEGYYNQLTLGYVQGRLILTVEVPEETLVAMLKRTVKGEYMGSGSRKFTLHPDDVRLARTFPLAAITLIPSASLDEEIVRQRFGEPAAIVPAGETLRHYLYPEKGLDVVIDAKGKEILQYVAPADFTRRIVAPLEAK
ncbi:MAG: hypothetical protein LBB55_05940 [Zoogloeaceae bacterium]|jgi:hypothetical protein|nr:hypothetical protein [Zoogloeaceae bacterium]